MARRKRPDIDIELDYDLDLTEISRAFAPIGEDARNWLKYEIVYGEDAGRRQMAREILGWADNRKEQAKIVQNVDEK